MTTPIASESVGDILIDFYEDYVTVRKGTLFVLIPVPEPDKFMGVSKGRKRCRIKDYESIAFDEDISNRLIDFEEVFGIYRSRSRYALPHWAKGRKRRFYVVGVLHSDEIDVVIDGFEDWDGNIFGYHVNVL